MTRTSGTEALDQARQRLMAAPRAVIHRGHGRVESYARGLSVIEEDGRVRNWANRRVEHYWLEDRSCYDSSTEFERADWRDQRRGAIPEASSARVEERSGRTLIRWRLEDQERAPDVEGSVLLDGDGRPVLVTRRAPCPGAGSPPARPPRPGSPIRAGSSSRGLRPLVLRLYSFALPARRAPARRRRGFRGGEEPCRQCPACTTRPTSTTPAASRSSHAWARRVRTR